MRVVRIRRHTQLHMVLRQVVLRVLVEPSIAQVVQAVARLYQLVIIQLGATAVVTTVQVNHSVLVQLIVQVV